MEHPCHRCASPVEDNSPFCQACGAPQVRFSPDVEAPSDVIVVRHASASIPASTEAAVSVPSTSETTFRNKSATFRSAASAGLIGALLSILPFGFLLGFPLAGFLSVMFYRRRAWGAELSSSAGFRLGVLTGALGFAIFVVATAISTVASHSGGELRQMMIEAVQRAQARAPDLQARQMLDYFTTPPGLGVMMILGLIFVCIIFVLLAGIGGATSASLLRRKTPPS